MLSHFVIESYDSVQGNYMALKYYLWSVSYIIHQSLFLMGTGSFPRETITKVEYFAFWSWDILLEEGVCSSRPFEIIEGINKVLKLLPLKNIQGVSFCLINHVDQNEFLSWKLYVICNQSEHFVIHYQDFFKKLNSTGEIKPLECYFALLPTKIKWSYECLWITSSKDTRKAKLAYKIK